MRLAAATRRDREVDIQLLDLFPIVALHVLIEPDLHRAGEPVGLVEECGENSLAQVAELGRPKQEVLESGDLLTLGLGNFQLPMNS